MDNYPSDFNVSAVPSARSTAISRFMAIWSSVIFTIIIFLCIILVWSARSGRMSPFLISISDDGVWRTIAQTPQVLEYSAARTMQEYVVHRFVRDWFDISATAAVNDAAWKQCPRTECGRGDSVMFGAKNCAISCAASEDVYMRFVSSNLRDFTARAAAGDSWHVDASTITANPRSQITDNGGTWDITATIISTKEGEFKIRALAKIARNQNYYPFSTGFYIADFNAYKVE